MKLAGVFAATLFLLNSVYSQTRWISSNGWPSGECQLESNKLMITIHKFHLDIEEEAVLSTRGEVQSWADTKTLEISGTFTTAPGTAMRSMLLWNGKQILKAKLLDRNRADSIMDSIVNRTSRDPALIEHIGGNRYHFRIFPVPLNTSRRIRILYSVPYIATSGNLQFEFQPAFTLGAATVPNHIPVEIFNPDSLSGKFLLQTESTRKTIQFGAIYSIPFADFNSGEYMNGYPRPRSLSISPDTSKFNKAYAYTLSSTKAVGYYGAVFATVPDSLSNAIADMNLKNYVIEAKIVAGTSSFLMDIPNRTQFGIYLKSKGAWDEKIHWNVYSDIGDVVIAQSQSFSVNLDSSKNSMLPLIWGAKYSLKEGLGNMGGLFGFVDGKMSLLALEKDTLSKADVAKYTEDGIPPLLPWEIVSDTSKIVVPKNSIIYDIVTFINSKSITAKFLVLVESNHRLIVQFDNTNFTHLKISIFDTQGRLVQSISNPKMSGKTVQLQLPSQLKGVFVMSVITGNTQVTKKFVLK